MAKGSHPARGARAVAGAAGVTTYVGLVWVVAGAAQTPIVIDLASALRPSDDASPEGDELALDGGATPADGAPMDPTAPADGQATTAAPDTEASVEADPTSSSSPGATTVTPSSAPDTTGPSTTPSSAGPTTTPSSAPAPSETPSTDTTTSTTAVTTSSSSSSTSTTSAAT
ncbi:MAG: hypothetical protein AAGD35_19660 [Actinomycetota bacterium]